MALFFYCPECGHKVDDNSPQCIYCGLRFVEQSVIDCPECGHEVLGSAKRCLYRGHDLPERPPNGERASQAEQKQHETELALVLARIALEWERERKKYMVKGIFVSGPEVPTNGNALAVSMLMGMSGIVLAIVITCVATDPKDGLLEGGFLGAPFLFAGLIVGVWYYYKAKVYDRAEAGYQRKRRTAMEKHNASHRTAPDESAS